MASLSWQLYSDCDEIIQLKSLCPRLGAMNLQFRKVEEYVSQGVLNRLMQDMLMNVVDGCYVILKDLEIQIQEHQKLEYAAQPNWNDLIWGNDQILWREKNLAIYVQGLSTMNANFRSESRAVVVQKFVSFIEDVKSGRAEGSTISQSLDYVTAEDGESELVWKSLRADLEVAGLSTDLIDKHRAMITSKFKEILDSGELTRFNDDTSAMELDYNDSAMDPQNNEDADTWEPDINLDSLDTREIFSLASRGQVNRLSAMIQAGIDPDLQDENQNTALHVAASSGQAAVVELLLAQRASTILMDAEGRTAMRCALENGHHSVLRILINHCTNPQLLDAKVDRKDDTILHYAVSYNDEDSVLLLLKSGASPNVQNRFGHTPLHRAAYGGNLVVLKQLLDSEVELDLEDFWGSTAFEVALSSPVTTGNKSAIIRMFLEVRLERSQGTDTLDVDLEDAVKFLSMESIYDINSEDNIFKVSSEGGNVAELLPKQFEMNDLAEELFETIYGPHVDKIVELNNGQTVESSPTPEGK